MKKTRIVRAWVDEAYRSTLSDTEMGLLPDHPAGTVEIGGDDLAQAVGGASANWNDGCRSIMSCSALFSDCGSNGGGGICY